MKLRIGFVSNSSTSSFIVQTSSMIDGEVQPIIPQGKIDLLKEVGFKPTSINNPFRIRADEPQDDTYLRYYDTCNQEFVLQFLVAKDIPFKASVHYDHWLYSYDPTDGHVYILANFGIQYFRDPGRLEKALDEKRTFGEWSNYDPMRKIPKEDFLQDYNEEDSIRMMIG